MLEAILGQAVGVAEAAGLGFPILEAAAAAHFQVLRQSGGHNAVSQALLEQQQTARAAVAVLEREDAVAARLRWISCELMKYDLVEYKER